MEFFVLIIMTAFEYKTRISTLCSSKLGPCHVAVSLWAPFLGGRGGVQLSKYSQNTPHCFKCKELINFQRAKVKVLTSLNILNVDFVQDY